MKIATPGVYVQEISKFPPSVAAVETAIPAFIGYTEKATMKVKGDLKNKATRIVSMLEYEHFFGGASPEDTITVSINDVVNGTNVDRSIVVNQPTTKKPFLMYYSLQLYFANGGGPCYIVSVGRYGTDLDDNDTTVTSINDITALKAGLDSLEKVDEPTLLLFPDATSLSSSDDFYSLYGDALAQCNKLQDRFTIIDTHSYDGTSSTDPKIAELRDTIRSENDFVKYGAAYYPFLETILNYVYNEGSITISHVSTEAMAVPEALKSLNLSLISVATVITALFDPSDTNAFAGSLVDAINFINDGTTGFDLGGTPDFSSAKAASFIALLEPVLQSLSELSDLKTSIVNDINATIASVEEDASVVTSVTTERDTFLADFEGAGKIDEVISNLKTLLKKLKKDNSATKIGNTIANATLNFNDELAKLAAYSMPAPSVASQNAFASIETNLANVIAPINTAVANAVDKNNGALNGRKLGDIINLDNITYNRIKKEIDALPITLPPSSAIAGVYAKIDSTRGVWKAPANTSLNYVIQPTIQITNDIQDRLNIDAGSGKSINAIRSFTGKGTLVWGARTLAGNDNEWRYVSVRRFFNFVEESVKKATEQFVFEPNDANTWVRVRAMIENFLINQWRAGALAGAKPDQAFYVRVGLGQTMTAQDILEGKMFVEIGMAVVRPAEFIILKFSHKMQEA